MPLKLPMKPTHDCQITLKSLLSEVHSLLKKFSDFITSIINVILLIPVYFIGVGFTAVIARLFKKQFLDLYPDKKRSSYWHEHPTTRQSRDTYRRMF